MLVVACLSVKLFQRCVVTDRLLLGGETFNADDCRSICIVFACSCSLRRQPRKPDGTNGFNLPLVERTCGEYFEVQLPESDTAVTAGGGE